MRLDHEAAERAIGNVAIRLGLSLLETAAGITRIVDSKMSDLIRRMSVLRGFDPRDFVCFAFGGGGPVHAGAVSAEIGLRKVVIPLLDVAPVWSAFGAATADVSHLYTEDCSVEIPTDVHTLGNIFDRLEERALQTLFEEGFERGGITLERAVRMRYATQIHDVEVPIPGGVLDDRNVVTLAADFDRIYRKTFGNIAARVGSRVQITRFEVRSNGITYKPSLRKRAADASEIVRTSRPVYWPELTQSVETEVLRMQRGVLPERLRGPALIELPYSVGVVRPGQVAESDEFGNVVVTV
jgi:N-methylhydantoinase A